MDMTISEERNQVLGGERDLSEIEDLKRTIDIKLS